MEFLIAASLSDGHCGPATDARYVSIRRSLSEFAKRVGAAPQRGHQEDPRAAARPLQDHAAGDPVRHAGRDPGARGSASPHSTRTRCSTSITSCSRSIGAGRTIGWRTRSHRRDVDGARLDLPHRDHRVQRALDPQLADPSAAVPTFCGSPASWPRATASSCWRRCTTRC